MRLIGVGVDIVDLKTFRKRLDAAMIDELFLPGEIEYCDSRARPWESYAARFAAKEAVFKALGAGLSQGMGWKCVEILREVSGRVTVELSGAVLDRARTMGVGRMEISISHTRDNAIAIATASG
ncbi:MAG: hypothetical protein AVO35_04880 [Candidatus Aegiribacteria sp. MLS_C]|nr:MAG: hypothetical protein AVO35_04880 [Candidatus Aegiribacteria sp. MLS_C]